jgi:hypothetical protein
MGAKMWIEYITLWEDVAFMSSMITLMPDLIKGAMDAKKQRCIKMPALSWGRPFPAGQAE